MRSTSLSDKDEALTEFIAVLSSAQLPEGALVEVRVNGWKVLLLRDHGRIRAFHNRCTHASAPLHLGKLRHGEIMCPLHGARFNAHSGEHAAGRYTSLGPVEFREQAGQLEVRVPARAPSPGECPIQMPQD